MSPAAASRSRAAGVKSENMLFVIGAFITLTTVVALSRVRVPGGVNAAKLGWMSEQWMAEQRASRPS